MEMVQTTHPVEEHPEIEELINELQSKSTQE